MLEIIIISIIGICLVVMIILGGLYFLDKHSNSKFFCSVLKWHKDPKWQDSDGFCLYGECPRCHKTVYQDKWGNWDTKK
jgi:hypothetical protein